MVVSASKAALPTLAAVAVLAALWGVAAGGPPEAGAVEAGGITVTGAPYVGESGAPVTVVIFCDFQSPACRDLHLDVLPGVIGRHVDTGEARMIFMDFATIGERSPDAARAAHCAGEQRSYTRYQGALYGEQASIIDGRWLSDISLIGTAVSVGLNGGTFQECLSTDRHAAKVAARTQAGRDAGVESVPAVFVSVAGWESSLPTDGDGLSAEIESALAASERPDADSGIAASDQDNILAWLVRENTRLKDENMELRAENARLRAIAGPAPGEVTDALEGDVRIGVLVPRSGNLTKQGEEALAGAEQAASRFNDRLEGDNKPWKIRLEVRDTRSDPVVAAEQALLLQERGVRLLAGPTDTRSFGAAAGFASGNGMLIAGCCPDATITGDGIYRLGPPGGQEGRVLASLMADHGIKAAVGVWRHDDGTGAAAAAEFSRLGGTTGGSVRLSTDGGTASEVGELARLVDEMIQAHGRGEVAVFHAGPGIVDVALAASEYDGLLGVRWYSDGWTALNPVLTAWPAPREFADTVGITAVRAIPSAGTGSAALERYVELKTGGPATDYARGMHDAVWITGLALEAAGTQEPGAVSEAFVRAAASSTGGAIGEIDIGEDGGVVGIPYEAWTVRDGGWTNTGPAGRAILP